MGADAEGEELPCPAAPARLQGGPVSTPKEERFLDEALLDALDAEGAPGRIAFTDPDAILQIETIDGRAGISLWDREDLQRYPFLGAA